MVVGPQESPVCEHYKERHTYVHVQARQERAQLEELVFFWTTTTSDGRER
jgi:hypothetical protein